MYYSDYSLVVHIGEPHVQGVLGKESARSQGNLDV